MSGDDFLIRVPELGTTNERLRALLAYAVLAPSSHNSQPWRFGLGDGYVELWADRRRALRVVDPQDRELVISCGAALHHLRAAAIGHGHAGSVEILPRPAVPDLLARFTLGAACAPSVMDAELVDAMRRRRTTRRRFAERPLADGVLGALEDAARVEGAWLHVLTGEHRLALATLVGEADRTQMKDGAFRRELAAWMAPNVGRDDGIPGHARGQGDLAAVVGPLVVRTFDLGRGRAAADRELAAHASELVILGTRRDDVAAWLAAGQALSHVLLRATVSGVSASFLNQPIEVASLRDRVAAGLGLPGAPQIVLRLGYSDEVARPTPRRPLSEVLLP